MTPRGVALLESNEFAISDLGIATSSKLMILLKLSFNSSTIGGLSRVESSSSSDPYIWTSSSSSSFFLALFFKPPLCFSGNYCIIVFTTYNAAFLLEEQLSCSFIFNMKSNNFYKLFLLIAIR